MLKLTIDFETRSRADLKKVGMWRYAEDPSTEIICCAVKVNEEPARVWYPLWVLEILESHLQTLDYMGDLELFELLEKADEIEGHNVGFETAIWLYVATPKYGWPQLIEDNTTQMEEAA